MQTINRFTLVPNSIVGMVRVEPLVIEAHLDRPCDDSTLERFLQSLVQVESCHAAHLTAIMRLEHFNDAADLVISGDIGQLRQDLRVEFEQLGV